MKVTIYGPGGFDPSKPNSNIIADYEIPDPPQAPLEGVALVATLNAVLGMWSLQDAANIAQLPEEALIVEAQAWAVAAQQTQP